MIPTRRLAAILRVVVAATAWLVGDGKSEH
jgi:hypothetical protein